MSEKEEKAKFDIIKGVEGLSLYINDVRVAGPKPWGGGTLVKSWIIDKKEALKGLGNECVEGG